MVWYGLYFAKDIHIMQGYQGSQAWLIELAPQKTEFSTIHIKFVN
jgi:hypothetical protein